MDYQSIFNTLLKPLNTEVLWGAIKGDETRTFVRCPFWLNSKEYQAVLSKGLCDVYDTSNIFVQDGATCHKSR